MATPDAEALVAEGLISVAAAAVFLGLSRSTVYGLMEKGELPFVKLGRSRRIPKRAVIELAAANVQGGWAIASPATKDPKSSEVDKR